MYAVDHTVGDTSLHLVNSCLPPLSSLLCQLPTLLTLIRLELTKWGVGQVGIHKVGTFTINFNLLVAAVVDSKLLVYHLEKIPSIA